MGWSLTPFTFPRVLAPPHVRDQRGWIPEFLHPMGGKRAPRRGRPRRVR